jgi:hypothetical protein
MKKPIIAAIIAMFSLNVAIFIHKSTYKPKEITITIPPAIEQKEESPFEEQPISEQPKIEVVPEFVEVPESRKNSEQSVYGDVMRHSQESPFGDKNGRSTNVHETVHGINSYLRNKYYESKKVVNGFYALEGRGVIIDEPNMRKSNINKFVPESLQSFRYALYIDGSQAWDDKPLYIYDEWTAYVLGGKCNIEDVQNNRHKGEWSDGVSGCLDFSIYSIALSMAVKEIDPDYWASNKQFRDYTIWNLREAYKTYIVGHKMDQFKWDKQDALLKEFLSNPEAETMRKFVKENLEGVWLDVNPVELALTYEPYQCKTLKLDGCHFLKRSP